MSAPPWFIYTPLAEAELRDLVDAYHRTLAAFEDDHPGLLTDMGEVVIGGRLPSRQEAFAASRDTEPGILEALARCRSVLRIERPGAFMEFQAAAAYYLLERLPGAVFDWGENALQLGTELQAEIADMESGRRLSEYADELSATADAAPVPSESDVDRILAVLETAANDVEARESVQEVVEHLTSVEARIVEAIASQGLATMDGLARACQCTPADAAKATREIVAALSAALERAQAG